MTLRNSPAPYDADTFVSRSAALETARRSLAALETRGWVRWRCPVLDGEIILITDPAVTPAIPLPPATASYTLLEMRLLADAEPAHWRLVHEGKKAGGVIEEAV